MTFDFLQTITHCYALSTIKHGLALVIAWLLLGHANAPCAEPSPAEPMIVTHIGVSNANDTRTIYQVDLLELALEKTRDQYGGYRLKSAPAGMTQARALQTMRENRYPNYVYQLGFRSTLANDDDIDYVRFPTLLGAVGYRVCFTSPAAEEAFNNVKSLDDIRPFNHGQGAAWSDVKILRHNKLKVTEISSYTSLFKMTAASRLDIFCRGANEVYGEYQLISQYPNLRFNRNVALFYSLPMVYFTNKNNKTIKERLHLGLQRAYHDGSLIELWKRHFNNSIVFTNIDKRKVFILENPSIQQIDFDYQQYFYPPLKLLLSQSGKEPETEKRVHHLD